MNPFHGSIEDAFRCKMVRVKDGNTEYTGFLERIEHNQRHVVLRGAKDEKGNHVGKAMISHAENIDLVDEQDNVRELLLTHIGRPEWDIREFKFEENADFVKSTFEHGNAKSFIKVRKVDRGHGKTYRLVNGNKRYWAARQSTVIDKLPCKVMTGPLTDEIATFAWNHFPLPENTQSDNNGDRYTDSQVKKSVIEMYNEIEEHSNTNNGEVVARIQPITWNIKRISANPHDNDVWKDLWEIVDNKDL